MDAKKIFNSPGANVIDGIIKPSDKKYLLKLTFCSLLKVVFHFEEPTKQAMEDSVRQTPSLALFPY